MEISITLREFSGSRETDKSLDLHPVGSNHKKVRLEIVDCDHKSMGTIELFIDELQKALSKIAL